MFVLTENYVIKISKLTIKKYRLIFFNFLKTIFLLFVSIGQAGNVIQNMNASRMEFERQRVTIKHYSVQVFIFFYKLRK